MIVITIKDGQVSVETDAPEQQAVVIVDFDNVNVSYTQLEYNPNLINKTKVK
jgi:hypothetical protein